MRRMFWLALALVLLLTGCGGEKGEMSGRVQGARVEDGNLVYIGLHDYETGEDTRFYLTEDTDVISWTDDPDEAGFLGGDVSETRVNVEYSVRSGVYAAQRITVYGRMRQTGSITLSDGTEVGIWADGGDNSYRLSDGTELLREEPTVGPWDIYGGGRVFKSLPYDVRRTVAVWYREQGTLYDVEEELERIWATEGVDAGERHYLVNQETDLTAASPRVLYFQTSVMIPFFSGEEGGPAIEQYEQNAAFDRETGEKLDIWFLFAVPEEEARAALVDRMADGDSVLRMEMQAALRPEYITFHSDRLDITFPRGTLPSQEHSAGWGLDYQELDGLLQPWAIPEEPEQER